MPLASLAALAELPFVVPIKIKESATTSDEVFELTFGFFSSDGAEFGNQTKVRFQIADKKQAVIHAV